MKAIICTRYGKPDLLRIEERAKPVPKDHEILIRVHATTVSSADWRLRSLTVPTGFRFIMRLAFGFRGPRQPILGSELAGVIEEVGSSVTRFKPGDAVFGIAGASLACHAEYKCLPENGAVTRMPGRLDFQEAAALSFGGTTALDFFRRAQLEKGEKILINGASGAVGTAAVQLARHFGAEVTGVCSSANIELVKSLGAHHVIDYSRDDFARSSEGYDIIMDTAGTAPFSRCRRVLRKGGRLLLVNAGLPAMLAMPWAAISGRRIIAGPATEKAEDLELLARLAEAGEFRPVIDRVYSFKEIVDAHRHVDSGRKKGNVVITMT